MNTPKYITIVAMLVLLFLTTKADLSEIKHKKTGEPISIVKCVFDKSAFFWIGGREKNYIEKITSSISSFLGKSYFFQLEIMKQN